MWILYIILATGQVENLEFSNVESCQHAIEIIEIADAKMTCGYVPSKNVTLPVKPGENAF